MDILDPFYLLRYGAAEAILIAANAATGSKFTPDRIHVSFVESLGGTLTKALINTIDSENITDQYYSGSTEIIYNRLDMGDVFESIFLVKDEVPTTVFNILTKLSVENGIAIDFNDFTNAIINQRTYSIVPKPTSLRWVGQLNIEVVDAVFPIDLSEYFEESKLIGFDLSDKIPLSDVFLTDTAGGFSI